MAAAPTARAARLHAGAAGQRLHIDEVPLPAAARGEVVVAVQAAGVGGLEAELVAEASEDHPPRVLGREAAGVIAEVGPDVVGWQVGDHVAVLADRCCGTCAMCRGGRENLCHARGLAGIEVDGVLTGFVAIGGDRVVPVPPQMGLTAAAIVGDAVAVPYHALKRSGVSPGSEVAVIGVGGLGIHAVQLALLAGAHVLAADVDPEALGRAEAMGAETLRVDPTTSGSDVVEVTEGGAARVLEFTGTAAGVATATGAVCPGGRVVLGGRSPGDLRSLATSELVTRELEVVGTIGATAQDVGELFDLVEEGRLDLTRSVTHTTNLDGLAEALDRYRRPTDRPVRTVVTDLS